MVINKELNETELTISLIGRLDTTTSPELETEISNNLSDVTSLIFDFKEIEYISSAGLRVLLFAQKIMSKQGSMVVRNVNDSVMEVFEITGFSDVLIIE